MVHNMFLASCFSCVGESSSPAAWVVDLERGLLARAAPGPHRWQAPDIRWQLQEVELTRPRSAPFGAPRARPTNARRVGRS